MLENRFHLVGGGSESPTEPNHETVPLSVSPIPDPNPFLTQPEPICQNNERQVSLEFMYSFNLMSCMDRLFDCEPASLHLPDASPLLSLHMLCEKANY